MHAYEEYLRTSTRASELTITNYLSDVRQASRGLDGLTLESARKFINAAKSQATKHRRFYSMHKYIKWAVWAGLLAVGSTLDTPEYERPHNPQGLPKPVPAKEYKALVEGVLTNTELSEQDRLIILLLVTTGRRVSEILHIQVKDISENADHYTIQVVTKGGQSQAVYIDFTQIAAKLLREALSVVKTPELFQFEGKPYWEFRKVWREQVSKQYTIHQVRHTVATKVYQQTKDLKMVQKMLGHASINTSNRYAQLADEQFRQEMKGVQLV